MKLNLKSLIPHVVAIAAFILVSCMYFSPLFEGYTLRQGDVQQYKGMSKEIEDYRILNGKEALWTNAMFGGMPAYQISTDYPNNYLGKVNQYLHLGLPRPVGLMFIAMLGFYIFALCLRINPWLGLIGGLAFGLSTINVLYIGAGHITKVNAIAYMAPTLGGLILAFRGKWLIGSAVFGLFLGLNMTCNHFQMTYYLLFLLGAVAVTELIRLAIQKEFIPAAKAVGALALFGLLGVLPGIGNVLSTLEYSKYTTRGTTELTIKPKGAQQEQRATEGLNTDYILEYNYGKGEILSIIAPNAKGAKDDMIGNDEGIMEQVDSRYAQQIGQMNRYWGGQRMSGGAFYFGAVMCVLFIFGLIFLKDWMKWPFLVITLLALLLASKDPGGINDFFIHKIPMYNKFRDSKMILVLIQVMFPALGLLFLDHLLAKRELQFGKKVALYTAGALVFLGLILYAVPSISGSFMRADEIAQFDKALAGTKDPAQVQQFGEMKEALIQARVSIYRTDVGRLLFLILVGAGLILAAIYEKISKGVIIGAALVAIVGDNLSVCRRYLNSDGDGATYNAYEEMTNRLPNSPQQADLSILNREKKGIANFDSKSREINAKMKVAPSYADLDNPLGLDEQAQFVALNFNSDYRVLTMNNPFNETAVSYFHKSIGGYHGAKLKRYQEVVDFHVSSELQEMNQAISDEKNKRLQVYAQTMPITKESAQAVFDTIQVDQINLADKAPVLNMLNLKYVILDPTKSALENTAANGEAWFVSTIKRAANANEEMTKLNGLNSKQEAVVHAEFKGVQSASGLDSMANIKLLHYGVNELKYVSQANVKAPAIFSEIWYPEGWNCYIDGKQVDVFRANYILRGAMIPAGKHTIEWKFEPATYAKSESMALMGSVSLLLSCLVIFGMALRPKQEEKEAA